MQRKLEKKVLYHMVDGEKVIGAHNKLWGDCSGLSGNCSGLWGDCSRLWGDIDSCELSEEDRARGINISDLIGD